MLHVANGDHALSVLRAAGLPGEVTAWSDALDQGPVRGEPATAEARGLRAAWLAEDGAGRAGAGRGAARGRAGGERRGRGGADPGAARGMGQRLAAPRRRDGPLVRRRSDLP